MERVSMSQRDMAGSSGEQAAALMGAYFVMVWIAGLCWLYWQIHMHVFDCQL
jgi:hypothetical protein